MINFKQRMILCIFVLVALSHVGKCSCFVVRRCQQRFRIAESGLSMGSSVESFISALDYDDTLNIASKERTQSLNLIIDSKKEVDVTNILKSTSSNKQRGNNNNAVSVRNPGLWESMQPVAAGNWKVIYAPHMSTIVSLAGGGDLDVQYLLNDDGTLQSHAKFTNFPWMIPGSPKTLYLSVSGTFQSESDIACKVQWDKAWIRVIDNNDDETKDEPHARFEDVPDSFLKNIIASVGNSFFVEAVSVFPISFLSDDLIVFDFELLGTRICAAKIKPQSKKFSWKWNF